MRLTPYSRVSIFWCAEIEFTGGNTGSGRPYICTFEAPLFKPDCLYCSLQIKFQSLSIPKRMQEKINIIICFVCLARFKCHSKKLPTGLDCIHTYIIRGRMILHRWRENPKVRATEFHSVSCIHHHSSTLESTTSNPWFTIYVTTIKRWFTPVTGCVDPQHLPVPSLSSQGALASQLQWSSAKL